MKPSFAPFTRCLATCSAFICSPYSLLPLPVPTCLIILSLCLAPGLANAQDQQRFGAGLIFGLTAAQIDGDQSAGFNKLGLQAGLRGIVRLGKRTDGSIEILYAQRGAQNSIIKTQFDPEYFTIRLNYIEIPVQWHFKDWRVKGEDGDPDWYKAAFNIGLSYARYMGSTPKGEPQILDRVALDFLRKNDLALVLGANFMASQRLGFTFRYVRSLTFMYDPRDYDPAPYGSSLISRALYFQTVYLF